MSKADRVYLFVTIFLAIAAIAGGVMLAVQQKGNKPVEIVLSETLPRELRGQIYIGGAVANPGLYFIAEGDTLQTLLSHAGIEPGADLGHIELYVPQQGEAYRPQRIDINRAELWLLQALPGIGEVTAQAILAYRSQNGPFSRVEDLLNVGGIGPATFAKIKDYITVCD